MLTILMEMGEHQRLLLISYKMKNWSNARYIILEFFNKGTPFLILPIFSHLLSPQQYSELEVMMTIFTFVQLFCWFNVNTYYARSFYENDNNTRNRSDLALLPLIVSFFLLVLGFVFFYEEFDLYFYTYCCLSAVLQFLFQVNLIRYQFTNNFRLFCIIQLSATFINVTMSIFLVLYNYGAIGRFIGLTSGNTILGLMFFISWICSDIRKTKVEFEILDKIKFGIKLLPYNVINGWLKDNLGKIILIFFSVNQNILGIYGLSFSYSLAFNVLINAMMLQLTPKLYKFKLDEKKIKDHTRKHYFLISIIFVFSLPAVVLSFLFFVSKNFHDGVFFIPIFMSAYYFNSFSLVSNVRMINLNIEKYISYISVMYIVVFFCVFVFLFFLFKINIAYSVAVSYLIGTLCQSVLSFSIVKVNSEKTRSDTI